MSLKKIAVLRPKRKTTKKPARKTRRPIAR
jgi:hypothetical protein